MIVLIVFFLKYPVVRFNFDVFVNFSHIDFKGQFLDLLLAFYS